MKSWFFQKTLHKLVDAMQDRKCAGCHSSEVLKETWLCLDCQQRFKCRASFHPLSQFGEFLVYSATQFNAPLKKRLYGYKFYHHHFHHGVLKALFVHYWSGLEKTLCQGITGLKHSHQIAIVPVPSRSSVSSARETYRSPVVEMLAKDLALSLDYQYLPTLLKWNSETTPQHRLTKRQERLKNVKNRLYAEPNLWHTLKTRPRLVIIVDDIATTFATAREAHRALLEIVTAPSHILDDSAFPPPPIAAFTLTYIPMMPTFTARQKTKQTFWLP